MRYQMAWQQVPGVSRFNKLWAARAVASHKKISIFDPTRFATVASTALQGVISGIFHITEASNVKSIIQRGLTPGGNRFGRSVRADVHFTAFTAFETNQSDNRGAVLAKRLGKAQREGIELAVDSMDVERCWHLLRICVANGYFLCNKVMPPSMIDSIVTAKWSPKRQQWTFEFLFERSIENTIVHGYER